MGADVEVNQQYGSIRSFFTFASIPTKLYHYQELF